MPFYWWIGDTLTREHLAWQLDMLARKRISSLQINYCHTDTGGHHLRQDISFEARPLHSAWWELFGWFMTEAGKRGMTVSLSDYTLGVGQGSYVDEMLAEDRRSTVRNCISTAWNSAAGSVSRGLMRSGRFR